MSNIKVGSKVIVVNLHGAGIVGQDNLIGAYGKVIGVHDDLDLQLDVEFENKYGGCWYLSYDNVVEVFQ